MNSNGRNRNNTFAGDVLIDGDLVVTGTINGGGGGGGDVTNPMTSDLNANNYQINNVSQITAGSSTQILMGEINLQNNVIRNANLLEVNNIISPSGLLAINSNLDAQNYAIFNVSEITAGEEGSIKTGLLDLQDNDIINVNEIKGSSYQNKLYISAIVEILENLNMTDKKIINVNEIIGEAGTLKLTDLDIQDHNIFNVGNIYTTAINSQTGATAFTSILNMFNDINMDSNDIFNVDRLTTTHAGVSINLDMIPATEGKAGQVLARDPAFDPLNFATHKLVWANQSAGGGVTNPMTANLQAAQYSIFNAQTLESKNFNVMASGSGLSCANGTFAIPITWGLAQKLSLAPFYQTFNTDYITPATSAGLTLDSKAPDGITDSKITLSAPTININNSTNLAPSNINITGNLQITNSSGYIHGNNLIVRGRNASAVPTPITIEGTTTSINSSTLNITSSTANNIAGTTNFTGTVRTNTIDANSGGTISILQNLTLAVGKQLKSDLVFTNGLRSNTTDLILAGLLPDNKTQTNILISSPIITLNNQFDPLLPESCIVNILGTLRFDNTITDSIIRGGYILIDSKYTNNTATPLYLKGSEIEMTSSVNDIKITVPENKYIDLQGNVIVGDGKTSQLQTDFLYPRSGEYVTTSGFRVANNLNVLTARSSTIGVRTTIFKTFGAMPNIDLNTLTPVKINTTIANQRGTNLIPAGGFVNGDKFIIIMYGLLTTVGSGSLNISLNVGATTALNFIVVNVASTNQPCKITIEIDCTVSGNNVNLANGTALLSMERFNTSIRFATANSSNLFDNRLLNNTFDIYMFQSATQTSNFTPLSYTIEQM